MASKGQGPTSATSAKGAASGAFVPQGPSLFLGHLIKTSPYTRSGRNASAYPERAGTRLRCGS